MRKIELDEVAISNIKVMAALGLSVASIAAMLRENLRVQISERSLWSLKKNNPKVREAFAAGLAKAEYNIGRALYERASEGDLPSIKYFEATRLGRSEKQVQEVHHKGLPEPSESNVLVFIPDNGRGDLTCPAVQQSELPD
ncbi:hypothetical protein H6F88_02045 [Oculatella sp. FACHB-28]|uniref:hypothetical protein n=1 Tax=Oculatella sp. FACHB-28 TaxID=2692845 RepID=UPI00168A2658|nr:hypothetical protein [Oculatella sp. FACHB-28]MBD2054816.1 hypothetical protein [Oculatella sp. FACHB-28]